MAYSLNRAQVLGNVTRDPEVKQTSGGQTVATFAVATNRSWTDSSGQKVDKADFHNVVVWGKLAEIVQQYVKKGQKIFIEGRMQTRDWEGEDGQKRYRTELVCENMIMLGRNGEPMNTGGARSANSGALRSADAPAAAKKEEEVSLDDLPF